MITVHQTNTILSAIDLLKDFASRKATGLLKVSAKGVYWFICFHDGEIFYANFSIDPFERLEFYIYRVLMFKDQRIEQCLLETLRQQTANISLEDFYPSYDYQTLHSLVCNQQISVANASLITRKIIKETLCNFLLLTEFTYDFIPDNRQFPLLFSINLIDTIRECQREINDWQALKSNIYSFYQRPFVSKDNENHSKYNYLKKTLIGVDFFRLGLTLGQSAIRISQSLDPLIASGVVGLLPPQSQYANLPLLSSPLEPQNLSVETIPSAHHCKVVCVDDSPTILQRIEDFLDSGYFQLFLVQNAGMAMSKIITVQPHVILMDIDMPNIDGYSLCRMVRCNKAFKNTPIIMVTSNYGLIDRAKAKICGATDYMTKPFTQDSLNQMVLKYVDL
jgi:two-component system, chemotaxis family, response regulator PixG